ncbi:hypothetical protein A3860_29055 [Niastella vici]|uniref:Uncharacterized protein n=1 Tax=Niastella vici TaxID=1703345 RepID=A0A1V9FVT3_9BACT|nr:contractile injection system tape measure protein [Niastella vici]OQP62408.1 hypothetical protein A3860_29055 [Niastella vici]
MGFIGKHIILKQVIDLEYHGQADGFALQRQVSDWCHRELIPQMEEQLGKLRTKGKVYRIDKLEIAVQVDGNKWMADATVQIVQQLHDQVEQEIQKYHTDSGLTPATYQQLFVDAFIYFLQHGHLPWWSPVSTHHIWLEELDNLLITGFGENARARLLHLLKQQVVQQRVLYEVPDELFIKLMVQINSGIEQGITNLMNDIRKLVKDEDERRTVLPVFRQCVMACIYRVDHHQFAEHVYAHFVHQLSARGHLQHIPVNNGKFKHKIAVGHLTNGKSKEEEAVLTADSFTIKQEGIYIQNAGLIIVASFLPALFNKLDVFDGSAITDMNRAVCLVQYLASGRERIAEFELGLAKILCGLETDTPVDTNIRLTKTEKQEIHALLLSVIDYWEALKDTSPEGIQHSFLQRRGKLQLVNNDWVLQIEQKNWDVLLQQLPWSINTIKLPWMPGQLKTAYETNMEFRILHTNEGKVEYLDQQL